MTRTEAIDALSDGIECLDEMLAQSLLLDPGQALMISEARARFNQVQSELIEESLVDMDQVVSLEEAEEEGWSH